MAERILFLEDDRELGEQVSQRLRAAGFEVEWWTEGRKLVAADTAGLALVVLDLMLPGTYGMEILAELRRTSEVPVLVLSARNDSSDKVRALKLGADDYMTKPFWPDELLERVRARIRRPTMQRTDVLEAGPVHIDLQRREVTVAGQEVELTPVEYGFLVALARRPGMAITRSWLVDNVLDPDREGSERTLDVHASRLRKKLGQAGLIETVWGIGYRLASPA
ncbi:MAG TPA: response regulator transcription factor [Kofleriaceae bacterium]|nr:response regulator transcription factor [Kofleriaceae bacterium]